MNEAGASPPYPPRSRAIVVIAILMIVTCHSRLDQQFPALLVGPIRHAFQISDTQFSLFQGAAFAILYAVMGPFFGRMVDHRSRRNLIIFGVLFWSIMTMLSAFASSYPFLLITRMGVGIGEAVLAPAAYSLIADYVEPRLRGRAISIYLISHALGTGISLMLGGAIVGALSHQSSVAIPLIGSFAPWQAAFLIVGAPGVLTAILMFLIKEPIRRDEYAVDIGKVAKGTSKEFFAYMMKNKVAFGSVTVAHVAIGFSGNSLVPWSPTLYSRVFDLPTATIGMMLGVQYIVSSVPGFYLGGHLADRWLGKGRLDARYMPLIVGEMLFIPSAIIWPLVPDVYVSIFFRALMSFGHVIAIGTLPLITQDIVPNRMRGQAVTLVTLFSTLLGWAVGPTAVALFTDYVFHDDNALPYSIVLVSVPPAILALTVAWLGRNAYMETRRKLIAPAEPHADQGTPAHA